MSYLYRRFHILISMLLVLLLFGCAAQRLHDEGMDLVDNGHITEGLARLEEAAKSDPGNFGYKIDLIRTRARIINRLLLSANSQRFAEHPDEAAKIYKRVLEIDSGNVRARSGLLNLEMDKRHAASMVVAQKQFDKHNLQAAQHIVSDILLEDPRYSAAEKLSRAIEEQQAKDAISRPSLEPEFKKPVTLEFRDANLKMVVEALSRTSGLNILLDKDVRGDLKTNIFVKDASVENAIDIIALQDGLYEKILSNNTILLYPNTPAKVKEYQDLIIRSFHLNNADAKDMEKMVKTLLKTRDMYVDEKTNSLVMRDTPDAINLANKLITAQDLAQPEVMLEVEVLEVTRSKLSELGIKLPEQIALSAAGTPESTTVNNLPGGGVVTTTNPSHPLTLRDLKHLNDNYFTVSPINAAIDLKDESGVVNILASPRIRVRNREKAKILIGDRVPVITNAVTPVSTGTPVVTGNVQYLDVGLKLDVQPYIHPDDDVEIKVNLEVSNIVREISSGPTLAYQIGTRSANTELRLKDGETQVLAGLINDEDRKAAQKFPGLGDLPVLGRLFSSHKNDAKKTEIVLSITPHLTRSIERPDASNLEFWSGTDSQLRSRPVSLAPTSDASTDTTATPSKTTLVPFTTASPQASVKTAKSSATPAPSIPVTQLLPKTSAKHGADDAGFPFALSWNAPNQARVGDEFQVTIEAQAKQPVSSMTFTLGYDRASLKIAHIAEGDLFRQNGKKTVFTSKDNPDTGHAFCYVSSLSPHGARGKGSIAVITFKVESPKPKSPIVITAANVLGSNGNNLPTPTSSPLLVTLNP